MNNRDRLTEALLANSQTPAGQMSPYAKPGASGFNGRTKSKNILLSLAIACCSSVSEYAYLRNSGKQEGNSRFSCFR